MSNIVNLNEIVPGLTGTKFTLDTGDGPVEYAIPGDLPSETVFEFLALYDDLLQFRIRANDAATAQDEKKLLAVRTDLEEITGAIRAKLLAVFQIKQPDLKVLPFGNQTTMVVLGKVLETMGLGGAPVEEDPPTPAKKPAAKRSTAKKTTSSRTKQASSPRRRRKQA